MGKQRITLQDIPDWQLYCMRGADGHHWERSTKPRREGRWGWRIHKRCTECGKEKVIIHNATGHSPTVYYEPAPNLVKITEPYDTADVRAEYLRRTTAPAGARRLRSA